MEAFDKDSRVIIPFMPTLFHMSLAKVAIGLYNEFDIKTLREVLSEIESGKASRKEESPLFPGLGIIWQIVKQYIWNDSSLQHERVKKRLLLLPTILRKKVMEVVERVHYQVWRWVYYHINFDGLFHKEYDIPFPSKYNKLSLSYSSRHNITDHSRRHLFDPSWSMKCHEKCTSCSKFTFFWRSDGTIDREKTARELVRNENVDLRARFEIACMYCLVDSVQSLWAELVENGEAKDRVTIPREMSDFWIKWLREGSLVPWTQALYEYFELFGVDSAPRFSAIFRELMPADRWKFLKYLRYTDSDDIRFCLYIVTNKEQENVLNNDVLAVYTLWEHMEWPLTSIFLETGGRMYGYLQYFGFCTTIEKLLRHDDTEDFDFKYLAMEFMNKATDVFLGKKNKYRYI